MFVCCWKCACHKRRAEIVQNIGEDWQETSTLETKFQVEIFRFWDEVRLSVPRKKHPSGLEGWTHLGLCDGNRYDRGNATGSCHRQ